ncbi:hypothetical protein GCM10010145_34360 [Streptomyces ruber]|uniref:KaiB domain-containing protein n=2 Tax=Streptomyces TaxID=1883 RepID=A0A918BDJ4_9ACTN|nr:circadian clock KaiB family protein [Streptomyces ruber]GGQ61335.1 hypothetical protein GCM10010145_34360 [Streptomyces ruber]
MVRDPVAYSFTLYVAGPTERSEAARANLRYLCETRVPGCYEIDVVDVTERPELAEEHRVLATPTVIRHTPPPERRVIGDLESQRSVRALGLPDQGGPPQKRQER